MSVLMTHGRPRKVRAPNRSRIVRELMEIIERSGLTYAFLCQRAGVSPSYLSVLREIDPKNPGAEHMASIAEVLGYRLTFVPLTDTEKASARLRAEHAAAQAPANKRVPSELRDEYRAIINKGFSAREARDILGIK